MSVERIRLTFHLKSMTLSVLKKHSATIKRSRSHQEALTESGSNTDKLSSSWSKSQPPQSRRRTESTPCIGSNSYGCHTSEDDIAVRCRADSNPCFRVYSHGCHSNEDDIAIRLAAFQIAQFQSDSRTRVCHPVENCHVCAIEARIQDLQNQLVQKNLLQ